MLFRSTSKNSHTMYKLGRILAQKRIAAGTHQDSVVVLLFMGPTYVNRNYGVAGLHGASLSKVAMLVEDFATGYYNATGSNSTSHLRIVVATSNGTTECGGNQVSRNTGRLSAWMFNDVASIANVLANLSLYAGVFSPSSDLRPTRFP